jgi:succinate dehydrogenase / fumarate reductase cytochrome b subunit
MKVSDRTYYALKRLHSLTGVVPIGLFLLEHFLTNSFAVQGPAAFDKAAGDLASLPYVILIEALGIWLPIAFHMVLGVLIATTGQANVGRHGYARNWQYVLQRVSGLFLVLFIIFHTWSTRFSPEYLVSPSAYDFVREHVSNPAVFALYVLGVLSACWHFGNGLFGFAIHWGIATGREAQRNASRLGLAVFVLLSLVGINALLGFVGRGVNVFQKPHAAHSNVVFEGGQH